MMEQNQLDKRKLADIPRELKSLAGACIPQWHYSAEQPDTGSVIANIYAEQTAENIRAYNGLLARYEEELTGIVSLTPERAQPAEGVVVLKVSEDGIREADVAKGSLFYGTSEEKETPVVFVSVHDVHVTNAEITEILAISEKEGKVKDYGSLDRLRCPLDLFDAKGGEPYKNELVIFHPYLFGKEGREIDMDVGDVGLMGMLCDPGHYEMACLTEGGEQKVHPKKRLGKIRFAGTDGAYAVVIRRKLPVRREVFFPRLEFCTGICKDSPQFLTDGSRELDGDRLAVFGEEIALYAQCYIGLKEELIHGGVKVRIEADLEYGRKEHHVSLPKEEELKLIKRAPRPGTELRAAEVYISETGFSYYNGTGFRSIRCGADGSIFSGEHTKGRITLEFVCPADMEQLELGGWKGYALCLQVVRAENCYLRPGIHHYPIFSNLEVSYDLSGEVIIPESVRRRQGNRETDLTSDVREKRPFPAFAAFCHQGEAMLFGFGRKPGRGSLSLYLVVEGNTKDSEKELRFSYSDGEKFCPLRVMDSTKNLTASGLWRFFVPEDMEEQEIEGKRAFWIRAEAAGEEDLHGPSVRGIYLNGVQVCNTERSAPREYFLETPQDLMSFPVYGGQLLGVRVWVNEIDRLTSRQMRQMLQRQRGKVEAEYSSQGTVTAFYVLWEEVPDFLNSSADDRHYVLNRQEKRISFGDGTCGKAPRNLSGPAFKVETESCDGALGNVWAMAISQPGIPLADIGAVYNPLEASGGSDMEGKERVRLKSSMILETAGRLVTEEDYLNEARSFSEMIAQVKCRIRDQQLMVCILMKDFMAGGASFGRIQEPLERHLSRQGQENGFGEVKVCEPVPVKVNIRLWAEAEDLHQALEEKAALLSYIKQLFQIPVLGRIPEEGKILVMIRSRMRVLRPVCHHVVVSYRKEGREYIQELADLKREPFLLCVGGDHEIIVL